MLLLFAVAPMLPPPLSFPNISSSNVSTSRANRSLSLAIRSCASQYLVSAVANPRQTFRFVAIFSLSFCNFSLTNGESCRDAFVVIVDALPAEAALLLFAPPLPLPTLFGEEEEKKGTPKAAAADEVSSATPRFASMRNRIKNVRIELRVQKTRTLSSSSLNI
jgi:hypothetical protein